MRFLRKLILPLALLATLAPASAWATDQDTNASGNELAPEEVVRQATGGLLGALRSKPEIYSADRPKLMQLVDDVLMPALDFSLTSRLVLGRHWRKATEDQQQTFEQLFRDMLLRTYTTPLLEYADDVNIEFQPASTQQAEGKRTTVRTTLSFSGSKPVPVNYSMRRKDDGWKAYDVVIGGISAVVTFRSSFSEEIKKDGLASFLQKLAERNAELARKDQVANQ